MLGAGLGLGFTALLVLVLGTAGAMHPWLLKTLLCAGAAAGVLRARTLMVRAPVERAVSQAEAGTDHNAKWVYLWLLAVPFLVLSLLAASKAPGFVWKEEGFGYDILEYHLQLPREYLDAARITYLPHNVYANFPANVEMLYLLAMIVHGNTPEIGTVANTVHLTLGALAVCGAWLTGRMWSPKAGIVAGVAMATVGWLPYLSGLAYVENGMLLFGMLAAASLFQAVRMQAAVGSSHHPERGPAEPGNARTRTRGHPTPGTANTPRRWLVVAGVMAGFACGCKYTAVPMIAVPLGLCALLVPGRAVAGRLADGLIFALATLATFAPWLIKNQAMTGNPVFPLANDVFQASPDGWGPDETQHWNAGHTPAPHERSAAHRLRLLWQHILNDKHQRFGPALFLIALGGLCARRLGRDDAVLVLMLAVQLAVWILATHLYARFAVVLLIPLTLLAARALGAARSPLRNATIVVLLAAGSALNAVFAAQLQLADSPGDARASLLYDGKVPGFEYLGVVNRDLPPDARILLVGEARAFYFRREVRYCVVFNHNPFLEQLLGPNSAAGVLAWLRARDFTHVLVHWGEIGRLASSYGFSPAVEPRELAGWFDRLTDAGLKHLYGSPHPTRETRFVDLYEVPPRPSGTDTRP
jgi:hypothetical protein